MRRFPLAAVFAAVFAIVLALAACAAKPYVYEMTEPGILFRSFDGEKGEYFRWDKNRYLWMPVVKTGSGKWIEAPNLPGSFPLKEEEAGLPGDYAEGERWTDSENRHRFRGRGGPVIGAGRRRD